MPRDMQTNPFQRGKQEGKKMIVVTKDGRTLELNSNDEVKFTAAAYVGRGNCFFVEAMIHPRFRACW